MTPEEIGQLIELVIGKEISIEEICSIECVSVDDLSKVIDEVMTFRSMYSRNNSVVVQASLV